MRHQQTDGPNDALLEQIRRTTLPGVVSGLVDEYQETIGKRDRFLWKWLYFLFSEIELSCVPSRHSQTVRDAKLLASMYVVVLDDVAEVEADRRTFQEAAKTPFPSQVPNITRDGVDTETVELAARIWECVEATKRAGPGSDSMEDLLLFDVCQTISAVWYSLLLNRHLELASLEETVLYDSFNMMLFPYADIDLLHSESYEESELASIRQVVRRAQRMARIGNWITTWERELQEGDLSSGVIVRAIERDVVSRDEVRRVGDGGAPRERAAIRRRIDDAGIEETFLDHWHDCYRDIQSYESTLRTIDVESYLDGMETVLACHLASRGFK